MASQTSSAKTPPRPPWIIACRDAHLSEVGEPDAFAALEAIGAGGNAPAVTWERVGCHSWVPLAAYPPVLCTPDAGLSEETYPKNRSARDRMGAPDPPLMAQNFNPTPHPRTAEQSSLLQP